MGAGTALAAIALLGLAVRVAYTLRLGQHAELGLTDGTFYSAAANGLANGQGYIDALRSLQIGEVLPTAHHPPGWPALLGLFALAGVDSELGHRLVGCVVGAAAVLLVGLLGQRVGGRTVGLVAATLAALHPTLVAADGSLMSETLSGLLVLAALLAAFRLLDRPSAARSATLGLLIGLSALVRGEGLLYALFLVLPVAVWATRTADRRPQELLRVAGLAIVGMLVVVLPWTARNAVQLDGFVLISTNDSTVLAGANCDETYDGPRIGGWQFRCVTRAEEPISEVDQAKLWRDEGLDYVRDHADRLPVVVTARVLRTFGLVGGTYGVAEGRDRNVQHLGTMVWLVALLPLSVLGALLVGRRRPRIELAVLLAPVGTAVVVSALGFGMIRFRHSVELVAIVLTAVTVHAAAQRALAWRSGGSTVPPSTPGRPGGRAIPARSSGAGGAGAG